MRGWEGEGEEVSVHGSERSEGEGREVRVHEKVGEWRECG